MIDLIGAFSPSSIRRHTRGAGDQLAERPVVASKRRAETQAALGDSKGVAADGLDSSDLVPASSAGHVLKRSFDTAFAALALIALAPLFALIGMTIRLEDSGEVIYRQVRRGRHGELFQIAKFRTMKVGADAHQADVAHLNGADWPLFKVKGRDPRVTRVGVFLRMWSLDELPQLWNVLKGEMSLVGPRPLVVPEADSLEGAARVRLEVRPGMTGLWQTRGRHELRVAEMVRLDCDYVANWSLAYDFAILFRTIGAVLTRRGAY